MERPIRRFCLGLLSVATGLLAQSANPPHALTWQETQAKFKANNPQLLAGQVTIDESRADEITAYLRPNPDFAFTVDGTQIAPVQGSWRPFAGTFYSPNISYLHERRHKRELRLESAQAATAIAISTQRDLERNLLFSLRDAFVRVMLAKAVLGVAKANIDYYDKEIEVNRERFRAGAMARVDFQRVELQRVQFESDLENAMVNLRTAKIDLLALLRDNTPVDEFDVSEQFEFTEPTTNREELRQLALATRPDLKEAEQSLEKARTDHKLAVANGSTDPTFGVWYTRNGSFNNPLATNTLGASVSIPLRIFDRNQGEKLHTQLDIGRNQKLLDQAQVTALHDVDSAYATLESTITLLRPYKSKYLKEAEEIRDTISYSYQHGAASLLDFLDAQKEYRDTQLNYINLVGSYFSAANQVNFAVGQEVIR
ncbi:MAG TPA: TolC family protein [Bryobacteraceae bacterium]|jgi:cobalt-zinc-cadmium efflux system outer membrane protein|nr:TolC family protein [Bryobacteraceae bacterium]